MKKSLREKLAKKKKLLVAVLVVIAAFLILNSTVIKKSSGDAPKAKTVTSNVDRSFEFEALNNQGKAITNKVKFKINSVEKTDSVLVKDQIFTATNNKLFLIVNLEIKNDATIPVNILPGDLIRLAVAGDEENKFAPDLHNNLVPIAAISTRVDRVGFVIPDNSKDFKLYVGEIEGKKEEIPINFPS